MSTPQALKLLTLLNVTAARPPPSTKRALTYTSDDDADDAPAPTPSSSNANGKPPKAKKARRIAWNDELEQGPSGSGAPPARVPAVCVAAASNGSAPKAAKAPAAKASAGTGSKQGKKARVEVEGSDSSDDEGGASGPINSMATDAFHTHFSPEPACLSPTAVGAAQAGQWSQTRSVLPALGKVVSLLPSASPSSSSSAPAADLPQVKLVEAVLDQFHLLPAFKRAAAASAGADHMTPLQQDVHAVVGRYQDLFVSRLKGDERDEVRDVVLMHAVNHVLKTRRRILKMNEKLAHAAAAASSSSDPSSSSSAAAPSAADIDARDQGFTRPKILLLTPFRSSALAALSTLLALFPPGTQIENRQRFLSEFSLPEGTTDRLLERAADWPKDHVDTFKGNVDDNFRVGVKVTRKSVKLFGGFYGCDIVVGSPLGLRMSIEKEKSADFLSSVEVVVADQLDVMSMQNWEHVQFIFSKLNALPADAHGCDFSRVKPWYLDGQASLVRQTVLLSSYETPEMRALFNRELSNCEGKVRTEGTYEGELDKVRRGVRQTFTRFDASSPLTEPDARLANFTDKLMPTVLKSAGMRQRTLVVVPAYFDFVRVQAWFRTQGNISFAAISEYSSSQEISRARTSFFKGSKAFLLVTERFHFYRRYRLRGAQTYLFFGLPEHSAFYPELIDGSFVRRLPSGAVAAGDEDEEPTEVEDVQVKVLFSKWDWMRLERVVGTASARRMLDVQAGESVFSFV